MALKIGTRTIILLIVLLAAILAIKPTPWAKGVMINYVASNSTAAAAGLSSKEIIKEINGITINTLEDYNKALSQIFEEKNITITFTYANKTKTISYKAYGLEFDVINTKAKNVYGNAKTAGLRENAVILSINNYNLSQYSFDEIKQEIEQKTKVIIKTNKDEYVLLTSKPEFTVKPIAKTRLKLGLDLQGGARAIVRPVGNLTQQDINNIIAVIENRFNVYGITDVNVRQIRDLAGNYYVLVEMSGVTPTELSELISSQGKFEAKIGNTTVFVGGKKHITSVCQNPECSGVRECQKTSNGYYCKFEFAIYLSQEAAEKHANITAGLSENTEKPGYLNETLDLYLDDQLVDSLLISKDLKGRATTQIAISGPGIGATKQEAYVNALKNMKKLQTILITGSLPVKLEIVKLDSISARLGKQFLKSILIAALTAILAVALIVFLRYKRVVLSLPVIATMLSEIIIILGVAAVINWNLDLASIAGIIAAIGTGVDDQIVILDEAHSRQLSFKERIKRAFFIILGAYATTFVAMLPLWWAGAGLLKGFALTTIIGITIGVFITRPAFSEMISRIKALE